MSLRGQGERILVVDDEPDVRTAIHLLLRSNGYWVEAVASAEEALAQLETDHYDLVVTDNEMPGITGTELALVIKTRWPWLPVVMLSAHPPQAPWAALDLILAKPYDVLHLRASVRQILHRGSANQD